MSLDQRFECRKEVGVDRARCPQCGLQKRVHTKEDQLFVLGDEGLRDRYVGVCKVAFSGPVTLGASCSCMDRGSGRTDGGNVQ